MKKSLIVFAILYCNVCFSQSFSCVKVYISNPYIERIDVIKTQTYNMDYVRSHYATYIFSMEDNYINALFDSLQSFSMTKVDHDSVDLLIDTHFGFGMDMNFEPCIVIDFVRGNRYRYNMNEDVWTFSMDRSGYVCKTENSVGNVLFYKNKSCVDFLKRQFPNMFFLIQ